MQPLIAQNIRGVSKEAWIAELSTSEANRTNKRKDNVALYHEIMSFHQKSSTHLSEDALRNLAYEYAKTRNPNAHVLASVHRDTEHIHIHFLVSGTEYASGKATRLAKADLNALKEHMQTVQQEQYPELSDSIIDLSKRNIPSTDKEHIAQNAPAKPLTKELLQTTLTDAFAKSFSREEFTAHLKDTCDIDLYDRNGKATGITYNNQKFRFTSLDFDVNSLDQLDTLASELNALESLREQVSPTPIHNRLEELNLLLEESSTIQQNTDPPIVLDETTPREEIDLHAENPDSGLDRE